jgi:hypothetical protein
MINFILKFGKHKGQDFLSTPVSYQRWLLAQDWFNMYEFAEKGLKVKNAKEEDAMAKASRDVSQLSSKLSSWNGYSRSGAAIYDSLFEAEKAMDAAYFNSPDQSSSRWNGEL